MKGLGAVEIVRPGLKTSAILCQSPVPTHVGSEETDWRLVLGRSI
jgi:hypothetical protein